ncbi:protein kinase domain-containing protein [Saccharothrix sp. Mg75]|uniref:serine/threonine-protein kinase n=1 Tax=Saccharothrix sp. Mg75 TaxID=3445357 RepID=UPI003EF01B5C
MWDGDLTGELVDGRYSLGPLYGSGGMAEVYRGRDTLLDRRVAVKFFLGQAGDEDRIRLDREARVLGELSCPGLVEVYDTGLHRGRPYFVMQPVEGGTLRRRMRDPLPPAVVAHVGAQVAGVLAHVHDHGVVHRDVKPSNILLDPAGRRAYLADFGLALQAQVTRVTRSGVLVGTAGYLAPEQVRGADVSPAADVYALGLVLLECLTGRSEYPGGDTEAALARLHRSPRVPANLPAEWTAVLAAMTAPDPADRPSAAECERLLALAERASADVPPLTGLVVADDPVDDREPPRDRPDHHARGLRGKVLVAGSVAAAAALVVLAAVNLADPTRPADEVGRPGGTTSTTDVRPVAAVPPATTGAVAPQAADRSAVTVVREAPAGPGEEGAEEAREPEKTANPNPPVTPPDQGTPPEQGTSQAPGTTQARTPNPAPVVVVPEPPGRGKGNDNGRE